MILGLNRHIRATTAHPPLSVAPPCQLYVDGRPSSPIRRVVPRCSVEPLVRKSVPEMLGYVLEVVRFEAESLSWLGALECGGGRREAIDEWAADAP